MRRKIFIRLAIIAVGSAALASAAAAERIIAARLALFVNRKALPDKIRGLFRVCHGFEPVRIYVAEQPFVKAIEVARIDIAVALDHKLVHAVSADSALLGLSADIHLNPVVKLADAHIFAADVVFDIGVEQMYQKIRILLVSHIQFALALVTERAQARDELKIFEAFALEERIYPVDIFGGVTCEHGQNIKIDLVHGQHLGGIENFIESVRTVGVDSEAVRRHIAVKAQTHEEMFIVKEPRPLLIY